MRASVMGRQCRSVPENFTNEANGFVARGRRKTSGLNSSAVTGKEERGTGERYIIRPRQALFSRENCRPRPVLALNVLVLVCF
jgi:hypothetical protein